MRKLLFLVLLLITGCSRLETARLFDIGLKPFKEDGKVYAKIFDQEVSSCYREVISSLKAMSTTIIRKSRNRFVVVMNFERSNLWGESTEVALFFTPLKNDSLTAPAAILQNKTRLEVASLNYHLADFAAQSLFKSLDKDKSAYLDIFSDNLQ